MQHISTSTVHNNIVTDVRFQEYRLSVVIDPLLRVGILARVHALGTQLALLGGAR